MRRFASAEERAEVAEALRRQFELDRKTARDLARETGYSYDLVRRLLYEGGVNCCRSAAGRKDPRAVAARQRALKALRRA